MRITIPAIEVADEVGSHSVGCPLSVRDGVVWSNKEAKLLVALEALLATLLPGDEQGTCPRELLHAALCLFNRLDPFLRLGEAALQRVFERI